MKKQKIVNLKPFLILVISLIMVFSLVNLVVYFRNNADENTDVDLDASATKSDSDLELSEPEILNKFITGSTKTMVRADDGGKIVQLAIPLDANISKATLSLEGKIKRPVNQYKLGGRPIHLQSNDFNNDGNQDIVATDLDTHKLYFLYGTGDLNFKSILEYETGDLPLWAVVEDFNNDGSLDIATANEGANTITVYQNQGNLDGTFTNRKDYKIGDIPRSITCGDFNNDGWVDLAAVSSNDDKLWINFNQKNDTITFADAVNYSTDRSPVGITSEDLNKDGYQDLIIIHVGAKIFIDNKQYTNSVSLLFNNGEGEFPEMVDYIVGKKPAGVVTDDFNNDGWPDIATSNYAGYEISVLLNRGTGYMRNSINYSLNDNSSSGINLRTGDIDGDGDSDIVSLCSSLNHLEILRNDGDGTFAKYEEAIAGHSPVDLVLSDLDNDGDLDIATSNLFDGSVSVQANNGDGVFTTFDFYYVGGWPRGISNGDIDNDGDNDIITANYLGGSLSIRYNDGSGNFPERYDRHIAVEPFAVIVEDFDKDGYLDLASADEGLFELVVIYNDGNGKFVEREKVSYSLGGYPYSILYHDFNGDGRKDLITSNNLQQSISILWNIGNETGDVFAPFVNYSFTNQHPFGLHYGDMDGDGDDDLLCTNLGFESEPEHVVTIIWNNGNGTFGSFTNYNVGVNPINVRAFDLDHDGDLDLAVANKDSNSTSVLFNQNNKTLTGRTDYPVGLEPMGIEVVDFNYDGNYDIITANHANDSISILYNLGDGKFKKHIEYPNGPQPTYLSIDDFNQDGNLDIAASNKLTSSISVHQDLHYPEEITLYLGDSDTPFYTKTGKLEAKVTLPEFTGLLKSYVEVHEDDKFVTPAGDAIVRVPIKIVAQKTGLVELSDLSIKFKSTLDHDKDGIPDVDDLDDDNDELPDIWELEHDLDPFSDEDIHGGAGDADLDGYTNLEEFEENTDPRDASDHPEEDSTESDPCFTPGFESNLMMISIFFVLIIILFKKKNPKNY